MKKVILVFVGILLILPFFSVKAGNIQIGDLIRCPENSAVYKIGADGKRHAFPLSSIYFSRYDNFSSVKTVPLSQLQIYQLGKNITFKTGSLFKIPSVPKVYEVIDDDGTVEWIQSEEDFYARGHSFSDVKDLPETFWFNYREVNVVEDEGASSNTQAPIPPATTETTSETNNTVENPFLTDQDLVNLFDLLDNIPKVNKKLFFVDKFDQEVHTVEIDIPLDYYLYYKNKPHTMGNNFEYIEAYVTHDDWILYELSRKIRNLQGTLLLQGKLISDIELQVVQNSYYSEDWHTGFDEYPKYPIETIFEGNGDCEDLSFLFATLRMIYFDSIAPDNAESQVFALMRFSDHLGVGTAFVDDSGKNNDEIFSIYVDLHQSLYDESPSYYEYNGLKYVYSETTNPEYVWGEIPPDLRGKSVYIHELSY